VLLPLVALRLMLVLLSAASAEWVHGADGGESEWPHGDCSQADRSRRSAGPAKRGAQERRGMWLVARCVLWLDVCTVVCVNLRVCLSVCVCVCVCACECLCVYVSMSL